MKIKHCYVAKDSFDFLESHGCNLVETEMAYRGRLLPGSGGLNVLKFPDHIENNLMSNCFWLDCVIVALEAIDTLNLHLLFS